MAAATAVVSRRGNDSFRGVFSDTWSVVSILNPGRLDAGAGETDTVAVPGVALGDLVIGCSFAADLAGLTMTAYVSATNVVSIRLQNESSAAIDLSEAKTRVVVVRLV